MNALATDQARRIAALIHAIPAFKHVRAGLYVGGGFGGAGGGTVMTPTTVITDRETLRDVGTTVSAAGEYDRPDASELAGQNYFQHNEPILKGEVAALPAARRAELPPEDELWELLANEWFEAWEERAAKLARIGK